MASAASMAEATSSCVLFIMVSFCDAVVGDHLRIGHRNLSGRFAAGRCRVTAERFCLRRLWHTGKRMPGPERPTETSDLLSQLRIDRGKGRPRRRGRLFTALALVLLAAGGAAYWFGVVAVRP